MTTKQAIKVLAYHNKWRRGETEHMQNPTEIGIAIDTAIEVMSNQDSNLHKAYHGGWLKSKRYAKKTNFHGLNKDQIKVFFNKWLMSFKK